jgi:hypothetical protein
MKPTELIFDQSTGQRWGRTRSLFDLRIIVIVGIRDREPRDG